MNFIYKTFFIVAFIFSSNVFAQDLNPQQEEDLEKVEQLLRENPQLISNIHRGLQRFLEQQSEQKNAFANHQEWLYQSAAHPILGDKDAPHKIVVFTDYNCPFCKKLNMSAFRELGFRGTPTIIIGQQVTPGYIPYGKLETIATEQFELD